MMKSTLIVILLLLSFGSSAQTEMSQVLKQMPESVVPYLSANNRLDLIDFVDSNMKAEVHNLFDGKTELVKLTPQYAAFSLNEAVRMEIRLLDVFEPVDSANQLICLVRTYGSGDVQDSQVEFYSVNWRKLDTATYIELPDTMFTAALNENSSTITLTIASPLDRPVSEEQKAPEKVLTSFEWDGKIFK